MSAFDPLQTLVRFVSLGPVTQKRADNQNPFEGIGCSWALLGLNTLLLGMLAASFVQGPYSSGQQELWYRYGSLGLFLLGAALPALALIYGRRSFWIVAAATVWMLVTLLGFVWFVMMSGGGV